MEDKVKEILRQILENKSGEKYDQEINADSKLREDLGLDSFNLAELTVHIEEEFDVDVFEDGIVNTVGEIFAKLQ